MHRSYLMGAAVLLGTLSCPTEEPLQREPTPAPLQAAAVLPAPQAQPERALDVAVAPARDHYADWRTWAESPYKAECASDEECKPDRTGDPTYCRKRKGDMEGDIGTCRPLWLTRGRQKIQRENQRLIVDAICKPPSWYKAERDAEGKACWRFEWRTAKECNARAWCNPEKLHRFLRIPAKRESTWNHKTDHRLNPDLLANIGSYRRMYHRGERSPYQDNAHFFDGLSIGKGGEAVFGRGGKLVPRKYCEPMDRWDAEPIVGSHENAADRNCNGVPDRWERGYGWYGLNASNFTFEWDPNAPPEVLAKRVPATVAVLRKAKSAWQKLMNGIDCTDAEGEPWTIAHRRPSWKSCDNPKSDYYGEGCRATLRADLAKDTWQKPTWWLIHRAVWGGDVCPATMADTDFRERMFGNRAARVDLDPAEEISLDMLGDLPSREEQWALVDLIEPSFAVVFPTTE
jgi:hypothetical protein